MALNDTEIATWTPKLVGQELVAALRWAQAAAGSVGPAGARSGMPDLAMFSWEREMEGWDAELLADPDAPPMRRQLSPRRVSELERVLWWPTTYLGDLPGPARVLRVWCRCKVYRTPFDRACRQRQWYRRTAYNARDRALATIAVGLERDRVPLP